MKNIRRLLPLVFLIVMMLSPIFVTPQSGITNNPVTSVYDSDNTRIVDIGNGEFIELAPNEELHRYVLSDQGWTEWSGISDPLSGSEYGNSTNTFSDQQMSYVPGTGTTNIVANIPIGTNWEAYQADVSITGLTENRTWITNPGFDSGTTGWTSGISNVGTSSTPTILWNAIGHGTGDACVEVDINSNNVPPAVTFYYDANDKAAYRQATTVSRGSVVWSAFRMDYWADTQDDTHYGMTGSFRLYTNIEGADVWRKVFSDIGAEETWYNTGLTFVDPSVFSLPGDTTITTEIGLLSLASVGYAPNIHPRARFDNVELFLKTLVNPSEITMKMNSLTISNGASRGTCSITQIPGSPWTTSPVQLTFSWTPIPSTPNPNNVVIVEFDARVNMFARRLDTSSLYEISPASFGERFTVTNGSDAYFTSYYRANIPTGYSNLYYFTETIPSQRDIYFLGTPLAPTTNVTSGWTGGNPGDGIVTVNTYQITSEPGRYGYWRILSSSPNMISDLEIWDPLIPGWSRDVNLRAGDTSQIRVNVGTQFTNSIVNISIYKPDGSIWQTYQPVVDGAGYATTTTFDLAGNTAPAGNWMVQANTNNVGADGEWSSVGLFKRSFSITHTSNMVLTYPSDAVGTMVTNVTYGDLLLIILKVEDTDSSVLVPGGTMALDWVNGTDTFDDSGNGQYTKVIDTSTLIVGKGQYIMDLNWTHPSFDSDATSLTINLNYAASLTSPDYPGIQGPVGDNQSFTVSFKNINGTGITSGSVWCDWSNPYIINNLGLGQYEFVLDMTGIPINKYPVNIYAAAPYVEPQSMIMYVQARVIYNSILYSENQLSIPLGEYASFLLTWTDTDHGTPITGSASSITCNWTSFHSTGEANYTVIEITPGVYNITIFTESDDPLADFGDMFTVKFDVMKSNYRVHTFDVGVEIRKRNTLFVLDAPIGQVPIGDTISILVFYQDTDLRVGIGNGTGEVLVTVTSPGAPGLVYTSSPSSLGLGHYNITIASDQWGSIGWKDVSIFIEWAGSADKFYSQTINTSFRITGTDTDLFLELAPTATYYQNSFNFTIVYWDVVGTQRISNATGNHVFLVITALGTGHSVTQSDFTFYESGTKPGTYVFRLNSSLFPDTTSYRFQFAFMWEKGVSPLYENGTIVVTLIVLDRPTYIDYAPVASTPYGELAELRFSFVDTLTSFKIPNSAKLFITLNEGSVGYTYSYNASTMEFTIFIDTTTLGGIGLRSLHLNVTWVGSPFYSSVGNKLFTVNVILRSTQLSHLSFAPSQWGNNVTIVFVFTDIVDGITTGMTGTLTLNVAADKYSVVYSPEGRFIVTLNTTAFASDGIYPITATIVHTNPSYAGAVEIFDISILKRSTQVGYDSPDPAPYQGNVTFIVTYTDDSTGYGVSGAVILVTGNGTSSLVLNTNYWVTYLIDGQYLIEVDTVALGTPGVYALHVSISFVGVPYFLPGSIDVIARVSTRTTQILITQTPGDVAFLENVIFKFKYTDFVLGTKIVIDKSHITLTHGPTQLVIASGDYTLIEYATYYVIIFNSTIINALALESGHSIQLTIDRSSGVPYYAPRSTTTSVSTVQRQTQILFPLVEDTPYYDNITIELSYIDYLTGTGIDDADLLITSGNATLVYTLIRNGGGAYRIFINSSIFGNTGVVYFDITLSKTGTPFYSSRTTLDVPAVIKKIQTSLIAEAPPAGSTAIGVPIDVLLTLSDYDHGDFIEGAVILTDWTVLFGTSYTITELGEGNYMITLNMTGLLSEKHQFHVWAEKTFYQDASATVSVQPGASTVEIYLEKTTYYADWGQLLNITFQVREPYYNTPVSGMAASLIWDGMPYLFTEIGNGYYSLILDSSDTDFGIYQPQITVNKQFYQQRQKSFTLIVTKATGQIIPEVSLYQVVIDTSTGIQVYLNDTVIGGPVTTATVTMEFNGTVYPMTHSGGGYFDGVLPVTGFAIGQYLLTVRAIELNHAFLETSIDIRVVPIYSTLFLADADTTLITVYFGEVISIIAVYNDTYNNALISGANVTYILGSLTGLLTELGNNTYSAIIDVSSLAAQSVYLRLTATKIGYATALKSIIVTILPIPTEAGVAAEDSLQSGVYGATLFYTFYYNDTRHGTGINGANVYATWEGGTLAPPQTFGNGTYVFTVVLTLTTPGIYDLVVRFDLTNYTARTVTARIEIRPTPATIFGVNEYSSPINDTIEITYEVLNNLDSSQITDIIGIASSLQFGEIELELQVTGEYMLRLPGTLPYGTYYFDIYFSTTKYDIAPIQLEILVRKVETSVTVVNLTILTQPGTSFNLKFSFLDLDHGIGISGADITLAYSNASLFYYANLMTEVNGDYTLIFGSITGGTNEIRVTIEKEGYVYHTIIFRIQSDVSPAQQFQQQLTIGGGFGLLIVALLIVGYVKIWSIPVLIRALDRMIRTLRKHRIPSSPKVSTRQALAMAIVNEDLKSVKLEKPLDDIAPEPIITSIPEVNELLEELASITGLGEKEIEAFRTDLSRMNASERPGFLKEVITQERARRADVLAKPVDVITAREDIPLADLPGELEDLRKKLLKKGMAGEEIDIIIQEAKSLSKADIDALLDSLGIDLD